jgi:hypothetical protein
MVPEVIDKITGIVGKGSKDDETEDAISAAIDGLEDETI